MTAPKVSIIMPTYNRDAFILETIGSVNAQTYTNWELIIVDDGSDDKTEKLVGGLQNERIHFYKLDKTGIGGKIKNVGLSRAVGEFYAFIDSDDLWEKTKLEKQVAALHRYPDAGFCLTGGYNFQTANIPTEYFYKQREGVKVGNIFEDYFKSQLAGFTQALMLRKECISVTGLFKESGSFSDLDFILKLAWNYQAVIIYEPLFFRRLHDNNYINTTWEKSYLEGIEIIGSFRKKKMVNAATARHSLFNLYINFGEDYLLRKQSTKSLGKFFLAWRTKPISIVPLRKAIKAILQSIK